ncbi:MAG: regulator of ime2 [Vezdaea aestivalis]|nr:MAG: regulator of ime2 [Vezdaea aestivalis]
MLRPATPLSVILLIAFVLLLISVISAPIVPSIKLATHEGVDYGVFGYCIDGKCSGVRIGYNPETKNDDFQLSKDVRHSLTSLLIVHPIAALFTLILLILSLSAHLHSPSHSPKYLLGLLILTLPTLLLTLLAFLVDILLFVPHLVWGGWLVLASTILITASGIVTCMMRRTLVSRKSRKKRIAENSEMNGENYYARQNATSAPTVPSAASKPIAPLAPSNPNGDALPSFTTYDASKSSTHQGESEDGIPLQDRTPSHKSSGGINGVSRRQLGSSQDDDEIGRFGPTPRSNSANGRGMNGSHLGGRDEYGNPLPPSAAFGPSTARRTPSDPRSRNQYGNGPTSPPGPGYQRGPSPYGSGRNGYPPPAGRGGYGRGPPPGSFRGASPGAPNGDPRYAEAGLVAGAAAMGMTGRGQRGPPPGYNNGYGPAGPYRDPSPGPQYGPNQQYGRRPSPGPPSNPMYGPGSAVNLEPAPLPTPTFRQPSPSSPSRYGPNLYAGRETSPGPAPMPIASYSNQAPLSRPEDAIGQAVEMDATTGSPSHPPPGIHELGRAPSDVQNPHLAGQMPRDVSHPLSMSSVYSGGGGDAYVPARANWTSLATGPPPDNGPTPQPPGAFPVELPTEPQSPIVPAITPNRPRTRSSDNYYEDVEPRFSADNPRATQPAPQTLQQQPLPASLTIGAQGLSAEPLQNSTDPSPISRNPSYEDINGGAGGSGARSPAASDTSHFTSVSQRGVNPNWAPPQQQTGVIGRRPLPGQAQKDVPGSNGDFAVGQGPPGGAGTRFPGPGDI